MIINPQAGAIGVTLVLVMQDQSGNPKDISAATVLQIILRHKTNPPIVNNAAFVTDGKDGQIQYVTRAGDLDHAGQYLMQAHIEMPEVSFNSSASSFLVFPNL
jgi:hypothetical protein